MATTTSNGVSEQEEPAPKRVKTTTAPGDGDAPGEDDDVDVAFLSEFIQPEILTRRKEFQVDFFGAAEKEKKKKHPYPHVIIPYLLLEDFAQQVQTQVKQHSQVNFKESDLFRVYQSIDLANLQDELEPEQQDDNAGKDGTMNEEVHDDDDDDNKNMASSSSSLMKKMKNTIDARKIPAVLKLRRLLYSTTWRHFVERLVGLPINTLTDQVDCAFNCHAPGCHLLCHDDVIGTRKVSYILYLTDPSASWTAADGGALELYGPAATNAASTDDNSSDMDKNMMVVEPATIPTKVYLPLWNHMAFFVVEPGVSFHAVQEVLGERPRLSLQGWYHYNPTSDSSADSAASASSAADNVLRPLATLEQLKQQGRHQKKNSDDNDKPYLGETSEGPFVPIVYPDTRDVSKNAAAPAVPASAAATVNKNDDDDDTPARCRELSLEDEQYLSKFLNPTYLTSNSLQDICQHFVDDSSVQLRNFLSTKYIDQIDAARRAQEDQEAAAHQKLVVSMHDNPNDLVKYYEHGTSACWKLVGPSHKQRFLEYTSNNNESSTAARTATTAATMGEILHELRRDLLEHASFHRFLACVTNLSRPAMAQRGKIRRFRKGLDYTVAHYGLLLDKPILDATLCFVEGASSATADAAAADNSDDDDVDGEDEDDDDDQEEDNPTPVNEADVIWQSGDCGGFECYIEADDEEDETGMSKNNNEAFAEYNAGGGGDDEDDENDTDLLSVSASNNTLSLVYRDPGTMRFVKYVGSRAPSSRWDVAMEYLGEDQEEEEEEEDNDDDNDERE